MGEFVVQAISLNINDVNEAPVSPADATLSVDEGAAFTYDAHATDVDAGDTLSYSLSGADASAFSIDSTGHLTLNNPADFEAQSSYAVTVTATDSGGLHDSQDIVLNVNDLVEAFNLDGNAVVNAGIQAPGQTDTNFSFTDNGDVNSSVQINNFSANDVIHLINADAANVGFSIGGDGNDLRIDYSDTGDTNTISTIIINDVLDGHTPVFDEASAIAASNGHLAADFFQVG